MIVRIRSRDGLERVSVPHPSATISDFKALIESQLQVPIHAQTISLNQNLLLAKTQEQIDSFSISAPLSTPLHSLGIAHGSVVFLYYEGERTIPSPACLTPAGSFGKKMTMDDLIAKQMRVSRQETPHCDSVSFDRSSASVFQNYVNETLAFAVKRCGFMYGRVLDDDNKVMVDVIYEPPQQGMEREVLLMRDEEEEKKVEAIAAGLGMKKVGFIFTQAIGRGDGYTMSDRETLMAAQMHAESGIKEWVTAIVKLEVNEEGGADVHFEAFQMSDICIRLFKEGWFVTEIEEGADPKVSRMKDNVVVAVKDTKEVDNDFFLVPVKIFDHQVLHSYFLIVDVYDFFFFFFHFFADSYCLLELPLIIW